MGHVGLLGDLPYHVGHGGPLVGLDDADQHQWAGEAGTEALRQHVEGDTGRGAGRVGPLVGGAEA